MPGSGTEACPQWPLPFPLPLSWSRVCKALGYVLPAAAMLLILAGIIDVWSSDGFSGKEVFVESNKNDRYGRVLGKVWGQPADCSSCGKTLDTNHAQLLAGMAWWYRYYAKQQSSEDRGRYGTAEDEAKARGWGLWSEASPINPYDWRKGRR